MKTVLENDEIADALRKYMDKAPGFEGKASDLLNALNGVASGPEQTAKGWPKRPADLGKILRRMAPPLRKIGISVTFPDRENNRRSIIIAPVKKDEMPSPPSLPSFSNGDSDLKECVCRHRAVTDEEAAVTGDGSESDGDSNDGSSVTANPLRNNDGDGSDSSDNIFPNLTGEPSIRPPNPKAPPSSASAASAQYEHSPGASEDEVLR